MNPIIKWPGGKTRELDKFAYLIPEFDRYVEPFFGGGALYFEIMPQRAAINDISRDLMAYYKLVRLQDPQLKEYLQCYSKSFRRLNDVCQEEMCELLHIFFRLKEGLLLPEDLAAALYPIISGVADRLGEDFRQALLLNKEAFETVMFQMVADKLLRTVANYNKKPFNTQDLCENLTTGFTSGYYMYFRKVFNDIALDRIEQPPASYRIANFYFIREYCYGSMFRYNAKGEFNIPYGGMSYNKKDMDAKISAMFNPEIAQLFSDTRISCQDFEKFLEELCLTDKDFIFLDPPYDTDFSDYEGKDFTKYDQERLANFLKRTPAKFILVIKNTEFISRLYEKDFHILSFDKQYTYNVRSRNERGAEHLIITNLPVEEAL